MKKEVLSKAAKELDELLFEESQIKLNQKPEELQKDMEEASKELQSDDEVSDETLEVLTEIWKDRDGELTVKVCKIFRALGIVPLAKETVEDAEVIPETDELLQEVKDAERVKDLKDIARSDDEFKAIRGKLNGYKEIDDLRGEMLAILDGPVEETEPEEAPEVEEEKAAEPEYEKKGDEKKKEEPKETMKIVPKDEKKKAEKPKVEKQTRAKIFVGILDKNVPKTMTELIDEMQKQYQSGSGSVSGAKTFTAIYVQILKEVGLIEKNEKNQYVKIV